MTVLTIELTCEVYPTQPLGPYVQSHDLENPLMKSLPLHYSDCHMLWLPMLYKEGFELHGLQNLFIP